MIENVVEYLYQIPRFARTGGLEQTQERLRLLGNPEKSFRYIHVAGTNGKGSTCAYLESALRHMGFKTGLFTSPHLIRINERIRINNVEISDEAFIKAFHKVKELIDILMQSKYGLITLCYDNLYNKIIDIYKNDNIIDFEKLNVCIEVMNNYYYGVIGIDDFFNLDNVEDTN